MNILIINGSPKGTNSNTYKLSKAFVKGISEKTNVVCEEINVKDKEIKPCLGCFSCWNKTPGKCVIKDEMADILEKIIWADIVVWSFGLYFFNVPSKMKALIDRQLPLSLPFMISESEYGSHPARFDMSGKRNVVISTCGFYTSEGNYSSVDKMFDHFLGEGKYEKIYCGQGELFRVPELHNRADEYLSYVQAAGKEYINGGITDQTRNKLCELLFPREVFEEMADASWGIEKETGEIEDSSYIFTRQMASLYNKSSYSGMDIVLEMCYTDVGKSYQIVLKKDGYEVKKDDFYEATTTIETPLTVWKDIAAGKITGTKALMDKLYRVKGDFNIMLNWDTYFCSGSTQKEKNKENKNTDKGTSMLLTLIPWIAFWIAATINSYIGALVSIGVCVIASLIFFKFRKTIYDVISTAAVITFSVLILLIPQLSGIVIPGSYLAFGAMWSLSCLTAVPLTAWYSMNSYGSDSAFENPLFISTNKILTLAWGILYIMTSVWTFFIMGTSIAPLLSIINNALPIAMGIFTKWFQNWYPAHYASK